MTKEDYLRYYNKDEDEEGEDESNGGWIDALKHAGKHALVGAASAIPGSYLLGGAKAVPYGIMSGIAGGLATSLLSDSKDKSLTLPILTNVGIGTVVGAHHLNKKLNDEIKQIRARNVMSNQNINHSYQEKFDKVKGFLSNYSKEGIENFSEKLFNFMVIGELGAMNAMKYAPEDEKIRYGALGAGSGIAGGTALGALGGVSGALTGAAGGFAMGKGWGRIGSAFAGGVMGGIGGATAGGLVGSKLASNEMVKMLRNQKEKELLRKMLMKKYLTDKEKEMVNKIIASKKRDRAKEVAKDIVENYNVGFSIGDIRKAFGAAKSGALDALKENSAKFIDKSKKIGHDLVAKHPKTAFVATTLGPHAAVGALGGTGSYWLFGTDNPGGSTNPGAIPESALLGGGIGGLAGLTNGSPVIGAGIGALAGGVVRHLAEKNSLNKGYGLGLSLGASALAGYLASKIAEKYNKSPSSIFDKKEIQEKRGRGRPKKASIEDIVEESAVENPFL